MSVGESAVDSMFGARFGFRRALGVLASSEVHAGSGIPVGTVPVGGTGVNVAIGSGVGVSNGSLPTLHPTSTRISAAGSRNGDMDFSFISMPVINR